MSVTTRLPIADGKAVRRYVGQVAHRHPRLLWTALGLHVLAALTALAAPRLLGGLVESVENGTTRSHVDEIVMWLAIFLVLQSVLTRYARYRSQVMGELVLAELREDFVANTLALPVGTVEAAGSGDLLTRTGSDIDQLGWSVRWALPEWTIAVVSAVLTLAAALSVGWWVALPCLLALPPLVIGLRWYLARAKDGYLAETASYSQITTTLSETVEGSRTVEALGLGAKRVELCDDDCAKSFEAEKYTLHLRTVFFPSMELSYLLPVVGTLLFGGWLYTRGEVSLAEVTTATLYVQMLIDPVDRIVSILDELQLGAASLARLLGVAQVPDDREVSGRTPSSEKLDAEDVRFSYVEGRDVLHGIDLDVGVGERIAMVGPSGAGKSTLGRLLAGIHPPRTGAVTVGDVGLVELPLGDLRGHVALVTQEHHVFVGTLRENVVLARPGSSDDAVRAALGAVDALEWVDLLPAGLDTVVGSGGRAVTAAQAQQIALARLVLADPHTLVLDEATSLIDPRAARHLERSLAAVLEGRTVIAIAHRLFSAHDADRVAVVEDGRDRGVRLARRPRRRGRVVRRPLGVVAREGLTSRFGDEPSVTAGAAPCSAHDETGVRRRGAGRARAARRAARARAVRPRPAAGRRDALPAGDDRPAARGSGRRCSDDLRRPGRACERGTGRRRGRPDVRDRQRPGALVRTAGQPARRSRAPARDARLARADARVHGRESVLLQRRRRRRLRPAPRARVRRGGLRPG